MEYYIVTYEVKENGDTFNREVLVCGNNKKVAEKKLFYFFRNFFGFETRQLNSIEFTSNSKRLKIIGTEETTQRIYELLRGIVYEV